MQNSVEFHNRTVESRNKMLILSLSLLCVVVGWAITVKALIGVSILVVVVVLPIAWAMSFVPWQVLLIYVFLAPVLPMSVGIPILGQYGMIASPARVVMLLLFIAFAMASMRGEFLLEGFPLARPFLFYLCILALGIPLAVDPLGTLIRVVGEPGLATAVLAYIAFILVRTRRRLDQLISALLVAGTVVALIGLWEWTSQTEFRKTALVAMFSVGTVAQGGNLELGLKAPGLPRIWSTLGHSLILAGFMAFLLPLALQRVFQPRGIQRGKYFGITIILTSALILTFGRAALIAGVVETIAMVFAYRQRFAVVLLGGLIVFVALSVIPVYQSHELGGTSLLKPISQIEHQIENWKAVRNLLASDPKNMGFGIGQGRLAGLQSGDTARFTTYWFAILDVDLARLLAATGVFGFVAWLGIFWKFSMWVRKAAQNSKQVLAESPTLPVMVSLMGAFVTAGVGVSVLTDTQTWPLVGVCLGGVLGYLDNQDNSKVSNMRDG